MYAIILSYSETTQVDILHGERVQGKIAITSSLNGRRITKDENSNHKNSTT
jgi:hypothetical protein